jgi:hypothetical protein
MRSPEGWQLEHKYTVPEVGIVDGSLALFPGAKTPAAVIELKDAARTRDKSK